MSSDSSSDSDMTPFQAIYREMIDDILHDLCLKAHRAIKLGYFHTEEFVIRDKKFVLPGDEAAFQNTTKSSHSKSKIICLICNRSMGAPTFTRHLNTHRELLDDNRKSPNKRMDSFGEAPAPKVVVPFNDLSFEEQKALLDVKCCAETKKSGVNCKRSLNCPIHTNAERDDIRRIYQKKLAAAAALQK